MIYNYKGKTRFYVNDKWESIKTINGKSLLGEGDLELGAKLKLVERQESETNLADDNSITLQNKLKPNTIYMVTYFSNVFAETISTLLPIGFDGCAYVRASISGDDGSTCSGYISYTSSNIVFNLDDDSITQDPINKLEIYELTSGVIENTNEPQQPQAIELVPTYNADTDQYELDLSNYHNHVISIYNDWNTLGKETEIIFGYCQDFSDIGKFLTITPDLASRLQGCECGFPGSYSYVTFDNNTGVTGGFYYLINTTRNNVISTATYVI